MRYNFDIVVDRIGTDCCKWDHCNFSSKDQTKKMIPMWIADMDFPCPEPCVNAIHECADHLIYGYTEYSDKLKSNAISFYKRHFDWDISPDSIYFSNGVVPSVGVAIRAFSRRGDGVIVQTPIYNPFFGEVNTNSRTLVTTPMKYENGRYCMDMDALETECAKQSNKILILCSPQNPSGRVWTEDELKEILGICRKHDVVVVCDEIHCDLLRSGISHTPLLSIAEKNDRIVLLNAPSKTFNIPGLCLSNVIIDNPGMRKIWEETVYHTFPNPLSQAAAVAVYEKGDEWLTQLRAYLDDNFIFMEKYLKDNLPEIEFHIPEGTYLAWVDFRPVCSDSSALQKRLAENAAVCTTDGSVYMGPGFLRLNLGCAKSVLEEALSRIVGELKR